jgi:hypothetical protein
MTGSTTTSKPAPIDTIALLAVAQYAADHGHGLYGLGTPVVPHDPIAINLHPEQVDAWVETITLTADPVVRPITGTNHESVRYPGIITTSIGDVRVVLMAVRPSQGLQLVGAAS